jgi:energy-coupling factor transporter ATP-binding protein EcfA2
MSTDSFIYCDNLVKIYKVADLEVVALQGLDLAVEKGEMMALVGASGSGKSTLLNVIGGLDEPSAGKISVNGQDLLKISDKARVDVQAQHGWLCLAAAGAEPAAIPDGAGKRGAADDALWRQRQTAAGAIAGTAGNGQPV